MKDSTVFVGLDYHQDSVQVCVLDSSGKVLRNGSYENDAVVIASVVENHGTIVHAAIESCTGAADLADELAARSGWSVDLAHPGFVSRMKQNPDKTDFTDAHLLADLERVGYLPRVWLAPQEVRELRRLVRFRQQLVDERRAIKLRISALLRDQRVRCPARAGAPRPGTPAGDARIEDWDATTSQHRPLAVLDTQRAFIEGQVVLELQAKGSPAVVHAFTFPTRGPLCTSTRS
jgi:transposase